MLGYTERGPVDLVDRHGHGPTLGLQPTDAPRSQCNSIHIDISVPHDQAEARIAAAIAAGGQLVTDRYAPAWWVLADSEGNEACVATWMGRKVATQASSPNHRRSPTHKSTTSEPWGVVDQE